jgi:hypothetical protein
VYGVIEKTAVPSICRVRVVFMEALVEVFDGSVAEEGGTDKNMEFVAVGPAIKYFDEVIAIVVGGYDFETLSVVSTVRSGKISKVYINV